MLARSLSSQFPSHGGAQRAMAIGVAAALVVVVVVVAAVVV